MQIKVPSTSVGVRLDQFALQNIEGVTRSHIKVMVENGLVLVDGRQVKAGYNLKLGEVVTIKEEEKVPDKAVAEDIALDIVYEDDDLAVINKPKGMVVHPAVKNLTGTLVNALLYNIKDLSGINGVMRPGIVHRLDKDTSGLLVVAKNDFAHANLSKQIQDKTCHRYYLALVEGHFKEVSGEIITYIGRSHKNRLKMANCNEGKLAHTIYTVRERFDKIDLVEFELKTGRTHQIRVHCEGEHHPILGDKLYSAKMEKYFKYAQFLHAYRLVLTHPRTGERMSFDAPLPEYFEKTLVGLRK